MPHFTLESFFLIRNIPTGKYLKYTTRTKDQLRTEIDLENCGSFYADNIFGANYQQAVRIVDIETAKEMFGWLKEFNSSRYELLKGSICIEKIS